MLEGKKLVAKMQLETDRRVLYVHEYVNMNMENMERRRDGLQGAEGGSPVALEASWLCIRYCGLVHWTYLGLPSRTQV